MSIYLDASNNISNEQNIHFIPCCTNGNGTADMEKQFEQYTKIEENGFLSNSLRGYPLKGEQLKIPAGYKGVCFQETRKPLNDVSGRTLKAFGIFNEFTYWNYDKIPSNGDSFRQALQILDIAETLDENISSEDIQSEIAKSKNKKSINS